MTTGRYEILKDFGAGATRETLPTDSEVKAKMMFNVHVNLARRLKRAGYFALVWVDDANPGGNRLIQRSMS